MSQNGKASIHINITFRNTEASESVKQYVNDKIGNLVKKFAHQNTDVHVVVMVEKNRQIAEVTFRTDGADFQGREESDNLYASIDALVDSVGQQLRKHKERMTAHH
jgi:putative sigma-54 modulation protein